MVVNICLSLQTCPSTALPWPPDRVSLAPRDPDRDLRSPPSKRARSLDDRPESPVGDSQTPPAQRNGDASHLHQQESLLGQALEGGPTIITKEKLNSDSSMVTGGHHSGGEDSTAGSDSDTAATSDGGVGGGGGGGGERRLGEHEPPVTPKTEPADYPPHMDDPHHPFGPNGGLMDPTRGGFTGALLGIPGLLSIQIYFALIVKFHFGS
nr:unnamed protein product [Callosobruchus analis]